MVTERNRRDIAAIVAHLGTRGMLTERDEFLLHVLSEIPGLTLNQIHQLLWPATSITVTYQRLNKLRGWGLLTTLPLPPAALRWGLGPGPVYQLGPAGQLWLQPQAAIDWRGRVGRWDEPLLGAEVITQLMNADPAPQRWGMPTFIARQLKLTEALAGVAQWFFGEILFHVAGLVRPGIDWVALARNFHRAAANHTDTLHLAILLPNPATVRRVSDILIRQRWGRTAYLITPWADWRAAASPALARIWTYLPPEGPIRNGIKFGRRNTNR